jgi:ATP-dependent helicase/nuclease subunit A
MRNRLTPEQAVAAEARGSLAVSAGAGTGKTLLLAHRYLYHVIGERQSPLSVVAITFTERAALELRARIREILRAELHPPAEAEPIGPEEGALDREAILAELEAAQISTIHALCLRICQDHPEEAGVPHQVTILDDISRGLHLPGWIEDALDTLPQEVYDRIPYSALHAALPPLLEDPVAAQWAFDQDPAEWPARLAEERQRLGESLTTDPLWLSAKASLETLSGPPGDRMEINRQTVLQSLAVIGESEEARAEALARIAAINLQGGSSAKWGAEAFKATSQAIQTIRQAVRDLLEKQAALDWDGTPERARLNRAMIELLPSLREAFQWTQTHIDRAKRAARQLDFGDLEMGAYRALESPAVRGYYQRRWRSFLVDEFQDTNPVQRAILDRLQEDGSLTIVGDPKQGIYGFRRAEREVFEEARTRILDGGGSNHSLSRSFRTHQSLIESFNQVFAEVLAAQHEPLDAARPSSPHDGPPIRWAMLEQEKSARGRGSKAARVEAAYLAERIEEILASGHPVHDPRTQEVRPARPGDVAILCRTWALAETHHQALLDRKIPSHQRGGGDLLQTTEARDGLALLDLLGNPLENIPLLAVLRSPFFAISDRDLLEVRQQWRSRPPAPTEEQENQKAKRSLIWWTMLEGLAPTLPAPVARAVAILRQLLAARRERSASELFQMANRLTGYDAVLTHLPGGEQRLADWRALLELIQRIESEGGEDLVAVWRRLRRIRGLMLAVPRPSIEAHDAVTVSTVHGAKGLEWPIVVLPNSTRTINGRAPLIHFDPRLGVALSLSDQSDPESTEETGTKKKRPPGPAPFELLKQRAKSREEAESYRLLYVAMTRARDLVLLTTPDKKDKLGSLLAQGLVQAGIVEERIPFDPLRLTASPHGRPAQPVRADLSSVRLLPDPLTLPEPGHPEGG